MRELCKDTLYIFKDFGYSNTEVNFVVYSINLFVSVKLKLLKPLKLFS